MIKRVVIVVYPGVTLLDAAGPAQVFSSANNALIDAGLPPYYDLTLTSPEGGDVRTDTGITMGTVPLDLASVLPVDTTIISGGVGVFSALEEQKLLDWVVARHEDSRRLVTTCMGAFVTAKAGLLEGRPVATHWRYTEQLQDENPKAVVQKDPLFVRSGKIWSAAGVTSGIDMALAMVEEDHGHAIAMHVAQSLVVFFKRQGGQSQFSNALIAQTDDETGAFSKLHSWIAANLQFDLGVEVLARQAGMSPRTFARSYKKRVGTTPAKTVERLRVDAAKRLLEQPHTPLAKIAGLTGLGDEQRMRRSFLRHLGVTPHDYRRKFQATGT